MDHEWKGSNPRTGAGIVVPLESAFVAIDLEADTAYVAYRGDTGIRWNEIARVDGEVLARLGTTTHVVLTPAVHVAGGSE